ncbi:hypothetical protein Drorol1_Dr00024896 [Drosera rotundifolia]
MEFDSQGDDDDDSRVFSVRIVSIDYYMEAPIPDVDISYSAFQGEKVKEVPVIRVFGSTPAGQKACVHIHRALPYLYIPCSDIPHQSNVDGDATKNALLLSLEKALKLKGSAGSKRQHVHDCSVVRARKLYGYHASEELFMKIYLYNPHDVARAASLLLGGAVLENCLQPHESHIPFILQFLVDYNLYGMGLLHLIRMKFRLPVPDDSVYKEPAHVNSDAMVESQAGTYGRSSVMQFWKTTTIPDEWTWQYSSDFTTSSDQRDHIILRQSMCELEGDTTVDDILNQQFRMFTSFSQISSDVRMVQSLVPIWEEEYERSGTHVMGMLPDSGKPQPENVLKSLSDMLEHKLKLQELWNKEQPSFNQHVDLGPCASVTDGKTPIGLQHQDQERGAPLDAKARLLQDSLSHYGNAACSDLAEDASKQEFLDELAQKAADAEDMSLLKWFASSQAAEDLNSDDELVRDTILSPLLPAASIDEVIQKANEDYLSESQQECQDILDSIQDMTNSYIVKEKASPISSRKSTPRMDAPVEVKHSDNVANSSEVRVDMFAGAHCVTLDDSGSGSRRKVKVKKPSWGSLPLSMVENAQSVDLSSFHVNGGSRTENDQVSAPLAGDELVNVLNSTSESADSGSGCSKEKRRLLGCSVRDLMRKKRSHRIEPSEGSHEKRIGSLEDWKGPHLKELEVHGENLEDHDMQPLESPNSDHRMQPCGATPYAAADFLHGPLLYSSPVSGKNQCPYSLTDGQEPHSASFETTSEALAGSDQHSADLRKPHIHIDISDLNYDDGKHTSFHEKFSDDTCSRSLSAPCNEGRTIHRGGFVMDVSNEHGISAEVLPTMVSKNLEQLGVASHQGSSELCSVKWDTSVSRKLISHRRTTEGKELVENVGTALDKPHLVNKTSQLIGQEENDLDQANMDKRAAISLWPIGQSDASYSCMLTPAFSPPSVHSVRHWLSLKNNTAGDDMDSGLIKRSCLEDSVESPADSHEVLMSESTSFCHLEFSLEPNDENHRIPDSGKIDTVAVAMQDEQGKGGAISMPYKQCVAKLDDNFLPLRENSQISGPSGRSKLTPLSQLGFRDPATVGGGQQLTVISIEVQAECRGDLRPDPYFDAINIITIAIENDGLTPEVHVLLRSSSDSCHRNIDGLSGCKVLTFTEEQDLINQFVKLICSFDPDIIMGWDVQGGSLGFLAERSSILGVCLLKKISRTPSVMKIAERIDRGNEDVMDSEQLVANPDVHLAPLIEDEWGRTHASGVHVGGRIVLNVWRLVRGEVKLNMYTLEAVVEAVLRRKLPYIPLTILNKWFYSGPGTARYKCINNMVQRTILNLEILDTLDMINRTSELARVFGIDFFSVLSRGSQYRVESMLIRLAHTQNYIAISPGYQQVAYQPAMECLPLVMEPESGFYADPVIVLDFQSLYPSMIIAYNLCFSTCLGKIVPSKENVLGVSTYSPDVQVLRELNEEILVTPNGVMFVPSKVRKGVIPRLLEEILSTRIMVKQAMKRLAPSQQILQRIFNARQLALKLIANVTYGYTAAGFSGRMPCAEIADSIVQCGRRTLEKAISTVNGNDKWRARVIYGDTDSMFVLVKGRSLSEAFQIGKEIASSVTAVNPNPVTLKLEKVYQPCFLLTKKRYVGYSYESPDQAVPVFDAKGIETVRRDTCGAVAKTLEKSLRFFFEHQDVSEIKAYLHRQWSRIISGRVSLQDFVFAKEVRLGTYSTRTSSALPPAAIVATKAMRVDPRAEPRYGERVPYVVIHGEPGARLVDMVVDPHDLLAIDSPYRLNDLYYIKKQIIPALQRVFGLVGADLNQWFLEMPRLVRDAPTKHHYNSSNPQRTRIDYYYSSKHCVLCGDLVQGGKHLCEQCSKKEAASAAAVTGRTSKLERDIQHLAAICRHCGGGDWVLESGVKCTSLACSVFYERRKGQKELRALSAIATEIGLYPKCTVEWF